MKQIVQFNRSRLWLVSALAVISSLAFAGDASAYNFVSVADGVLTFTPATLVTPIVGAAVAAVVAAAVLFVLWIGVKAVKRFVRS